MDRFSNTHLTSSASGMTTSVGLTDASPGHYPATDTEAESVVVTGVFDSAREVREAWCQQMGTRCPV